MAFNLGDALKGVSELGTGRDQIEYIRLDLIDGDPNNFYQMSDIDQLAANIELCGLQQPIRVRPIENTDRYMVVSGHRRRKAIELLVKDDPDRWKEVPCIISHGMVSPTMQQLQLIFANSSTRDLTSAEISRQAAQAKDLLYKLKEEEGFEFPGRMRDHVAEIVKVSKSKLARLEVIRKGLAAAWRPAWEAGDLVENTAYELAKMPKACQSLLFEEKTRTKANLNFLYADDVKKFAERCNAIVKMQCSEHGGNCSNYENKMRKAAVADRYCGVKCGEVCCKDCPELLRCQKACPKLKGLIQQKKTDIEEANKQSLAAQAERDRLTVEKISAIWQRFGLARGLAFKEFADCKKAMNICSMPYDSVKMMQLECGEAKIETTTNLPFGYNSHLSDVAKLTALADLLECSIDWLLCRTDVKEMAQDGATVSYSDTDKAEPEFIPGTWYPASVEPPVGVPLVMIDSDWFVDNGKYRGCGDYTMDYGSPVIWWTLEPDPSASAAAPAVTGWRSGTPEAYGTYAAYVKVAGAANPMLRELLWTGDEWLMFGQKISDDVTVQCWMERPDF